MFKEFCIRESRIPYVSAIRLEKGKQKRPSIDSTEEISL
jgi:hypothetical protein